MTPPELRAASFARYPLLARALAVEHLALLRQLPLNYLGLLLSEIISFDWRFPAERLDITAQLERLRGMDPQTLAQTMAGFRARSLSRANCTACRGLMSPRPS